MLRSGVGPGEAGELPEIAVGEQLGRPRSGSGRRRRAEGSGAARGCRRRPSGHSQPGRRPIDRVPRRPQVPPEQLAGEVVVRESQVLEQPAQRDRRGTHRGPHAGRVEPRALPRQRRPLALQGTEAAWRSRRPGRAVGARRLVEVEAWTRESTGARRDRGSCRTGGGRARADPRPPRPTTPTRRRPGTDPGLRRCCDAVGRSALGDDLDGEHRLDLRGTGGPAPRACRSSGSARRGARPCGRSAPRPRPRSPSAIWSAVTEPKSLPSSPARAAIETEPDAMSLEASASYSPFCLDWRETWARVSDSACLTAPFSALHGQAPGDQVVARVAVGDLDDVARDTELLDGLLEDDLHRAEYGSSAI